MNSFIRVPLNTTPEQFQRLLALQTAFAQVCNALAPEVQKTRVWNRVALHHLFYRGLREKFPALGSQMVCNAIYAVSRTRKSIQFGEVRCQTPPFAAICKQLSSLF
jgi:hypothetical protein